jgi:predicted PurR-regulated permease PerM
MQEQRDQAIRLMAFFLGIMTVILVIYVLKTVSDLILPMVIALLLARLFEPTLDWLRQKNVPMGVSILLVLLSAGVVIGGIGAILLVCAQQLGNTLPLYETKANQLLHDAGAMITALMQKFGADVGQLDMSHGIDPNTIVSILTAGFGSAVNFLSTAILILFLMLMIIAGQRSIFNGISAGYGPDRAKKIEEFFDQVDLKVQKFLVSKTLVNLITGTAAFTILTIFGVDLAFVFGVLAFFLSFIPVVGGLVATVLPLSMTVLQYGPGAVLGGVAASMIVTNMIIDRVIEPKVMGKSMDLSMLVVFLAFLIFSWMWGAIGAILAVPITAIMKTTFEMIPSLRPLALMMSETPPDAPSTTT